MATNTYVAIETQTVTSTVASVTLGSGETIPQTYTDLVLVVSGKSTSGIVNWGLRFNGDTGSNYSRTLMFGNGSTGGGTRQTSSTSANPGFLTTAGSPTIIQIMNYRNTTTYKSWIARAGDASDSTSASVGLWRGTTGSATNQPITSITLFSDGSTSIAAGTTLTLYGILADSAVATTAKATGGTITFGVEHTYHTFTSSGTFTPTEALTGVDYLVVAGGGGGGGWLGGGGGAGGFRSTVGISGGGGAPETPLSLASGTGYTVTVGAGGSGGPYAAPSRGANGSDSVFSTITSSGGGGGGGFGATTSIITDGFAGGSGGGGGGALNNKSGGAGTTGQGFAGGNAFASDYGAGGGGGAGARGLDTFGGNGSNTGNGGAGGTGITTSIGGSLATYGGGGGGHAQNTPGAGGAGGGGAGAVASNAGSAATGNTGGGGGGGRDNVGGAGGSGIVIIRYAN